MYKVYKYTNVMYANEVIGLCVYISNTSVIP